MAGSAPRGTVKAVLFDMDGLLIDSERIYTRISNEVLEPFGKKMDWEVKAKVMGRPGLVSAQVFIDHFKLPYSAQGLLELQSRRQLELFPDVPPMPGAIRLVKHLHASGVPIAIATGSITRNYGLKSRNLAELFAPFGERRVCGDDVRLKRGKPFPDVFLIAASEYCGLDCSPDPATGFYEPPLPPGDGRLSTEEVLVFEDGVPGVLAAHAARMKCVWVAEPELLASLGEQEVEKVPATQRLTSLEAFKPEEWGLPPYPLAP